MAEKKDEKKEATAFEKQFEKIKKLLKSIPAKPGVYKMKDKDDKIIYIGKAKVLKNRVASYFQVSKGQSIKTKKMVEKICDIDYIETNSEIEALVLETNLIKEIRPKYNILMKDDKSYVYIKVSTKEDYPRLSIVRKRERDGCLYFGPRTSADACEKLINILRKIFPIRTCNLEMEDGPDGLVNITKRTIPVPCLDYHIKRCAGPCIDKIPKEEYNEMIKQIIGFLRGNYQDLITRLKYRMFNYAKEKKFEMAAKTRDQIKSLETMFSRKQLVSDPEFIDRDVIGMYPDFDKTFINLFQFREGKLVNQENFTLDTPQTISTGVESDRTTSMIESFLRSYYQETTDMPSELFLRDAPTNKKLWEVFLTEQRKQVQEESGEHDRKTVHILTPQIGKKNKILELSEKNAMTFAKQSRAKWISDAQKTTQACKDLADELGIEKELKRIECYDISHMGGEHTTASMVVFVKGSPDKKLYRHFKVKSLENGEIDDYASIEEILKRRLKRLAQFAAESTQAYSLKKPVKADFEVITKTLIDEKIIKKKDAEKLDAKCFTALYHGEDSQLVGYTSYIHHEDDLFEIGATWIAEEHNNRAIQNLVMSKLIERLPKGAKNLYISTQKDSKEQYLSYGFTELKKIPKQLKVGKDQVGLIYKIVKKKKDDSSFSQIPDLIIIDGGKGQLGVAHQAMKESGLEISLIGLAKREEEIFMPFSDGREGYNRTLLEKNSQALYLVQRIRDESHRFANELRKKLGKKKLTESEIDDIEGIGLIIKRRLLKEYGSMNAIKAAPMAQLERTVGTYIAKKLKNKLGDTSGTYNPTS